MNKRFYALDVLRCIAMLIVLSQHFLGALWEELCQSTSPVSFLWSGHFAVAIFFILSGFGIAYSRLTNPSPKGALDLIRAVIRRYLRFTIPILIVCLMTFLVNRLGVFIIVNEGFGGNNSGIQLERINHWKSVLEDGLWKILFTGESRYSVALWTMKYEWYASVYLMVLLNFIDNKASAIRYGMYIISGCIALIVDPTYCTFVVGVVLADVMICVKWGGRHANCGIKRVSACALLVVGCLLGSYPSYEQPSWWDMFLPGSRLVMQALHVAGALFVIIAAIMLNENKKSSGRLLRVSAATYEMYLVHELIILTIGVSVYKAVNIWFSYIDVVAVTILIGFLVNKWSNVRRHIDGGTNRTLI